MPYSLTHSPTHTHSLTLTPVYIPNNNHTHTPTHPRTHTHTRNAFLFDDIYYQMVDRVLLDRQELAKRVKASKEKAKNGREESTPSPQAVSMISTVPKIVLNA